MFTLWPYNMVDDTGYVCPLRSADFNSGCCPRYTSSLLLKKEASSKKYVCKDCHNKMQCCKNFENCVSCCMGKLAKEKSVDVKKNKLNDISKPRELIYDGIKILKPPDCFDKNIFAKCQCRCKPIANCHDMKIRIELHGIFATMRPHPRGHHTN